MDVIHFMLCTCLVMQRKLINQFSDHQMRGESAAAATTAESQRDSKTNDDRGVSPQTIPADNAAQALATKGSGKTREIIL